MHRNDDIIDAGNFDIVEDLHSNLSLVSEPHDRAADGTVISKHRPNLR